MCNVTIILDGIAEPIRVNNVDVISVDFSNGLVESENETLMSDDEMIEHEYCSDSDKAYHFYSMNTMLHVRSEVIRAIIVTIAEKADKDE